MNGKPLSHWETVALRELYPEMKTEAVAKILGRSVSSVNGAASKLNLRKSDRYLSSPDACRLRRGNNVGSGFRFEKGHVPENKGVRMPGFAPGRMAETQFRKGQNGHNWMPIGATRKIDGYVYLKVGDERRVAYTRNWRPIHVIRWEETNGPVPAKHALVFKDGNRENIELDNLELITRSELMRRNSIHNLPAELVEVIQLSGALKRKIRRITSAQEQAVGPAQPSIRDSGTA